MFCNQCGEDNRDDRDFCIRCGAPLKEGIEKTPKQIKKEEKEKYDYIRCETKTYNIINIILWSLLSVAAVLTLISFYLENNAKFIIVLIAFILLLGCFGLVITKRTMRKKTKEAVKHAEQETSSPIPNDTTAFEQIKIEEITPTTPLKEDKIEK